MNRRTFLYGLPTAALSAFGYAVAIEPRWLEETQKNVTTGRNLRRPLRVAHISDLHASAQIPISFLEAAFRRTLAMQPDIICITGDFVTTDQDFDKARYESALQMLSAKVPTYAVMGNHDGGAWAARSGWFATSQYIRDFVTRGGVQVLHNDAAKLIVDGMPLWLVGVGDWWSEELHAPLAFEKVTPDSAPIIVMNHNPDGKDDCGLIPWDLMLCGHTHGGQVIVPFYGPPIVPVIDTRYAVGLNAYPERKGQPRPPSSQESSPLPDRDRDRFARSNPARKGRSRLPSSQESSPLPDRDRDRFARSNDDRWIHTTRGIGNIRGFRVNCRPELSLLLVS